MKILPDKFRDQADARGNRQIGYKFFEKQIVRFWRLFVLGNYIEFCFLVQDQYFASINSAPTHPVCRWRLTVEYRYRI